MSLRDRIRSTPAKKPLAVECPDWGVTLHVYPLSARQSVAIGEAQGEADGLTTNLTMMIACVKDGDGNFVFQPGDEAWLKEKAAAELTPLLKAVAAMNGVEMGVEDAKKNLSPTLSSASPTDSLSELTGSMSNNCSTNLPSTT